jgi:hypothetical protein
MGLARFMELERQKRLKERQTGFIRGNGNAKLVVGQKDGYLTKLGGTRKNWKKRWFILQNGCLSFYESIGDKTARGTFSLHNCLVRDISTKVIYPSSTRPRSLSAVSENPIESDDSQFKGKQNVIQIFTHDLSMMFRNHRNLYGTP